jgi:hypothetical protein
MNRMPAEPHLGSSKEFMHRMTSNRWNPQLCEPFSDFEHPKPETKLNKLL